MTSQTIIKERANRKANPKKKNDIAILRKQGEFWTNVAVQLVKPKRQAIEVNLGKLDKLTKDGEVVVVPGKVLSTGELNHKLTLGAFSLSEKARAKLKGSKVMSIEEMAKSYKDGKGVKVVA